MSLESVVSPDISKSDKLSSSPLLVPSPSILTRLWVWSCESNYGVGAWLGYTLSTFLGVALVVLCIPQLWQLGEGRVKGLCFGCVIPPVFSLSSDPWQAVAFAGLYLNGVIAGCYGIYQGVLWVYMGGRQLRRQLLKQRREQEK
jgi:hypothetical protein